MSDLPLPKNLLRAIERHPAFDGGCTEPPWEAGVVTTYSVGLKRGWCLRGECRSAIFGFTQKAVRLEFRKLKPCEGHCRYRDLWHGHGPECQEHIWGPKLRGEKADQRKAEAEETIARIKAEGDWQSRE